MKHIWLYLSKMDLQTERRQCEQEGKDLAPLVEELTRVEALDVRVSEMADETVRLMQA